MTLVNSSPVVPREHEITIRVRYQETDGRVASITATTSITSKSPESKCSAPRDSPTVNSEAEGIMLVVKKIQCNYHLGAKDDDVLRVKTTVTRAKGVRIHHRYEIRLRRPTRRRRRDRSRRD